MVLTMAIGIAIILGTIGFIVVIAFLRADKQYRRSQGFNKHYREQLNKEAIEELKKLRKGKK